MNIGKIVEISGPVIDCRFDNGSLPKIKEALSVNVAGKEKIMEVVSHIGHDKVRCVLLSRQ